MTGCERRPKRVAERARPRPLRCRATTAASVDRPASPPAMADRAVGRRGAQRVDRRLGAESRLERAHRRPLAQLLDRRNRAKVGHRRNGMLSAPPAIKPMTSDPPKYRPLERFWPYAELPEQPTDEELAALDPDLHEALFGAQTRPFSITLVFPALDVPDVRRGARAGARVGRVPRDRRRRRPALPRALLVERRRRSCAISSRSSAARTPPRCSSTIGRCRTPASCGCRSSGSSFPGNVRCPRQASIAICSGSKPS